jgi:hypothetical protein
MPLPRRLERKHADENGQVIESDTEDANANANGPNDSANASSLHTSKAGIASSSSLPAVLDYSIALDPALANPDYDSISATASTATAGPSSATTNTKKGRVTRSQSGIKTPKRPYTTPQSAPRAQKKRKTDPKEVKDKEKKSKLASSSTPNLNTSATSNAGAGPGAPPWITLGDSIASTSAVPGDGDQLVPTRPNTPEPTNGIHVNFKLNGPPDITHTHARTTPSEQTLVADSTVETLVSTQSLQSMQSLQSLQSQSMQSIQGRSSLELEWIPKSRRRGRPVPVPVPNLTKKSRGRRVPTAAGSSMNLMGSDGDAEASGAIPGAIAGTSDTGAAGVSAAGANASAAGASTAAAATTNGQEREAEMDDQSPSPERTYACQVEGCGKLFHRGEHLKRHIRSIHTHEKREWSLFVVLSGVRVRGGDVCWRCMERGADGADVLLGWIHDTHMGCFDVSMHFTLCILHPVCCEHSMIRLGSVRCET